MKDTLCSYYTNSEDITSYMAKKMGITDDDIILEPSAGEGIFIDELLSVGKNIHIDALDIDEKAINILQKNMITIPSFLSGERILSSIVN